VRGDVALVTQQAWIQNATLKDNILYGSEYDHERYGRERKPTAPQTTEKERERESEHQQQRMPKPD
jgi:ABC-type multidrug transport system fused ATPase/permease subunit